MRASVRRVAKRALPAQRIRRGLDVGCRCGLDVNAPGEGLCTANQRKSVRAGAGRGRPAFGRAGEHDAKLGASVVEALDGQQPAPVVPQLVDLEHRPQRRQL